MGFADISKPIQEAMALYRVGRVDDAIAALRAVAVQSRRPEAYSMLARMLAESGRVDEAIESLQESASLHRSAATLTNLGMLLISNERAAEAVVALREALTIEPNFPDALNNLGAALRKTGETRDAVAMLERATVLKPGNASAWINLAGALIDLEMFDRAEDASRQAVTLAPNDPIAHFNAGSALNGLGRIDEAVRRFEHAIALKPGYVDALTSLGNAFHEQGRFERAIDTFREALRSAPGDAYAQWNLSLSLLLLDAYVDAWPLYEARWRHSKRIVQRNYSQQRWDGGALSGKRILLHSEQGLGDTLQFIRYAPLIAERGGRVILLCQPALEKLLQGQCGVEFVTSDDSSLPAVDVHCPLLSLPMIFNTTIERIPAPRSYLSADPTYVAKWIDRLGPKRGLRIGLNWAGSPVPISNLKRTVGLPAMAPLAAVEGATFYSLQVGSRSADALTPPAGMKLIDCSSHLTDYSETAALMSMLDVVVTCDTSVAHAAGALGVLTCVLLPTVPDWRWGLNRSSCPWYPSMRLFRQPTPGDYATPMRDVLAYLNTLANRA